MESHGVMFNPDRPMVMHDSLSLTLSHLNDAEAVPEPNKASLDIAGKRGNVSLDYHLMSAGKVVGAVSKKLLLGSLREYCPDTMAGIVEEFYRLKARGTRLGMDEPG